MIPPDLLRVVSFQPTELCVSAYTSGTKISAMRAPASSVLFADRFMFSQDVITVNGTHADAAGLLLWWMRTKSVSVDISINDSLYGKVEKAEFKG